MGRKKLSMSEKIRRYAAAHPNAKSKDIAEAVGCKTTLVYAVLHAQKKVHMPTTEGVDIDAVHKKVDVVNHPPHYTDGGIETIDFIQAKLTQAEFIGYLKGNALKYGSRIGKKGDADVDAGKMVWYAAKLREVLARPAH